MNKMITLNDIEVRENLDIFVLEDTLTYQKRMITSIRSIGFKGKIVVAASLAEANRLITIENPGLILSDWNLPDGTGIDFLKNIRSHKKFDTVPFLMVTTMGEASNVVTALKAGADGYVVKPMYESDLIEKLAFAFEKRMSSEESGGLDLSGITLKLSDA